MTPPRRTYSPPTAPKPSFPLNPSQHSYSFNGRLVELMLNFRVQVFLPSRVATHFFYPAPAFAHAWPPFRPFSTQHTTNHKRPASPQQNSHHGRIKCSTICFFSTTAFYSREPNLYEILNVPITATAADIKKQFYALSLRHHPDRNRTDPDASQRFARISAAYNVLRDANKRAAYDRENGIHHAVHRAPGQHPMGSHSSYSANLHNKGASYAGSRPASGLSKRRGSFRGPPPSFYAQGGYGATGRTGDGGFAAAGSFSGSGDAGAGAWSGPGQKQKGKSADPDDPLGFIGRNPLEHFNAHQHFRTQRAEDVRRKERQSRVMRATIRDENVIGGDGAIGIWRFFIVCGILVIAVTTSAFLKPSSASHGEALTGNSGDRKKLGKRRKDATS